MHHLWISYGNVIDSRGVTTTRNPLPSALNFIKDDVILAAVRLVTEPKGWSEFRSLVFAPITEEMVFRAVMVPALYIALIASPAAVAAQSTGHATSPAADAVGVPYTPWAVVCATPLWFGVAHVHHLIEKLTSGWSIQNAMIATAVQLTYTSIFGVIATLLFMRTGSIYSAILSHIICNVVQLPDIGFMTSPGQSWNSNSYSCMYNYRYLHLIVHALGLILFSLLLLPMTEVLSLESTYWGKR